MTATDEIPVTEVSTKIVRAACAHDCPDTCAMLVTVENGRAVEVRGDPDHPFTQGGLCVKVNDYQDKVYSPDRLLHPMRRSGPKGSGQFEQITWDEALDEIADRFRATIAEHGAQSIMPVSYLGTEGILNGLNVGDPFFNALGATISERTYCDSGACTAYTMTIGATAGVDPESLVHSRYIIIWACNMVSTNLHLWPFVAEAQRRGAKVVVIDPMRHATAKRADWHIPIRPGTDGALALAMMHVIIDEGLTDEAYIREHTIGYSDLVQRVREHTPEWAEGETGIPAADIRTLAREYATSEPSMIRIGVAIERHAGGGQTVRSIACLPALVGAWREVGGGLLQLPLWAFPVNWGALMHPELATPGTRVVNQFLLGQALTGDMELDPPINALMVYNSNPLVVCPDQDRLAAGLSRDDLFTVVSDHFLTDTARYADIVLPATTQLEQDDIMFSWGHFYVSLNTPAIAPLGEAVSNTELFRRLAARMGLTDPCFSRTDEQMMAEAFDWSAPAMEGISLDSLRETGWARLHLPGPDEYAPHAEGNFPTPSEKTEFRSSAAEAAGNFVVPLFRQGCEEFQPGGKVDPVPYYVPPRETADSGYRLSLISPKSHAFLNSSAGDRPKQLRVQGEQTIIVHPEDADERGIANGQYVRVFNERGHFIARRGEPRDRARCRHLPYGRLVQERKGRINGQRRQSRRVRRPRQRTDVFGLASRDRTRLMPPTAVTATAARCSAPASAHRAPTVADAMLTDVKLNGPGTTVRELRGLFDDEHVHAGVIVENGVLLAVVDRVDVEGNHCDDAVAVHLGSCHSRIVSPDADLEQARQFLLASSRRRLAVVADDGTFHGLLCLKRTRQGFCCDRSPPRAP